jgi:hypothetical protein
VKLDTTALADLNDEYNPQDILLSQTGSESENESDVKISSDAPEDDNFLAIGSSLSLNAKSQASA